MNNYQMVKFTDNDFELDVRANSENETVWLTQEEMATLFDVDRTRIVRHISNIYHDDELDISSTCAKTAHVQIEGNRKIQRVIKLYNLDMIISVGYRVKSKRGIFFRRWAKKHKKATFYPNLANLQYESLVRFEHNAYSKHFVLESAIVHV